MSEGVAVAVGASVVGVAVGACVVGVDVGELSSPPPHAIAVSMTKPVSTAAAVRGVKIFLRPNVVKLLVAVQSAPSEGAFLAIFMRHEPPFIVSWSSRIVTDQA